MFLCNVCSGWISVRLDLVFSLRLIRVKVGGC